MANSKKASISTSLGAQFSATLCRLKQCDSSPCSLLIALSGGVDSVVLLSLALQWQADKQAVVRAVYIDHGLQAQSTAWGQHCLTLCQSLGIDCKVVKVQVDLHSGLSPESAARDARYDAFKQLLLAGEYLCTAHHADDQAETLLLQLFRGAGVQGLASMPECREFGQGYLLRPLLNTSREEIERYATEQNLSWCEDPSNQDTRYDRNFVRNEVMPSLVQRWPHLAKSVSRSAGHCAEAADIANELAAIDLAAMVDSESTASLAVASINALPLLRRKNLLRYWTRTCGFLPPSQVQLEQILQDILATGDETHGVVSFGTAAIGRYRDQIYLDSREAFEPVVDFDYLWPDSSEPLYVPELDWQINISDHDNLSLWGGKSLHVRNRRGGERWKASDSKISHSVKTLLQQYGVPPWQRSRLVFVYCEDQLLDICGPSFKL